MLELLLFLLLYRCVGCSCIKKTVAHWALLVDNDSSILITAEDYLNLFLLLILLVIIIIFIHCYLSRNGLSVLFVHG